jgi:hypothetical protein
MWEYNDDDGLWVDDAYSYDPNTNQFQLLDQDVPMDAVPLEIRQNLEDTAWEAILAIIGDVPPIDSGPSVNFTDEFQQGDPIATVPLNGQTIFGSAGATPCLIIFSVGYSADKQSYYAKGAHRDNVYALGEQFLVDMSDNPDDTEWDNVQFYIAGGEVGSHTGVQGATMDYSQYYPFFLQCQQSEIQFGGIVFPSNPTPDDSTSAALALIQAQPNVHFWLG